MFFEIPRLYDSHAHFLGTGQIRRGLTLFHLQSPDQVGEIKIKAAYLRGEWLVGFGWDENKWTDKSLPDRHVLDKYFPERPVFFSRADGHSSWLNSRALQEMGMLNKNQDELPDPRGGKIHRGSDGMPNGILSDVAHMMVFEKLPGYRDEQLDEFLMAAAEIFNQSGFTHVRDMSCTETQWNRLRQLEDRGLLTVALDENFTVEDRDDLDRALRECLYARKHESPQLRAKGLKLFYDGSLGSETALLSLPYGGSLQKGLVTWDLNDIEVVLRKCWESGLEFSVHTIGDEAVHQIVDLVRQTSAGGAVGRLNLEHVQLVRPETIRMMKPLHIRCHMQPCHWLSDRSWLRSKLGPLYKHVFPWENLRAAQIPLSFGSDSPIEEPSLFNNLRALRESAAEGIREFKGNPLAFHSHPDPAFSPSLSRFEDGKLRALEFRGRKISLE